MYLGDSHKDLKMQIADICSVIPVRFKGTFE